ncbi:hypothetical protein JQ569_35720 [Bradyrhizobium elkanii]|nr:hypothetical protein [Bradyrhizobium elkanii]
MLNERLWHSEFPSRLKWPVAENLTPAQLQSGRDFLLETLPTNRKAPDLFGLFSATAPLVHKFEFVPGDASAANINRQKVAYSRRKRFRFGHL